MKKRFWALVLAGCLAAVLSTAAWATSPKPFYVELPSGETIALDAESGDSIENVKKKLEAKTNIAAGEQHLYYGGKLLVDGRTLADYNIQKGSTLQLRRVPSGTALTNANWDGAPVIISEKTLHSGTYYLCNDVELTQALVIQRTVTLDLNGFVLNMTGSGSGSGSVIKVENGTLTLVDSNLDAIHKFVKNTDDPWTLDESQGTEVIKGGVITGGNAGYNDGGGVYVCPGAAFVMQGGNIVGCTAKQGGGVYVADDYTTKALGHFAMAGGSIVGCVANDEQLSGGGVANHGAFTMTGGTIRSCIAADGQGGGIYSVRQLHISGDAAVRDCTAKGSYASSSAMNVSSDQQYTAVIAGGTFDGNVVSSKSTTITGGTFNGDVRNSSVIENGQFNGAVDNQEGTIKGGTFNGSVVNSGEYEFGIPYHIGTISGGTFNGTVTNKDAGIISGGTFYGGIVNTDGDPVKPTGAIVKFMSEGKLYAMQIAAAEPPAAPVKDGYVFKGWYTDEVCTKVYDFDQIVTESITLYAKWAEAPRYYYYDGTTTADEGEKGSPKTFDAGVGVYAVSAALSLTGTAWIGRKRH